MNPVTILLKISILAYRKLVSPFLPPMCRFYPSCSAYALEALERHGAGYGLWLTIKRLGRCHPWNPGGYDPVEKVSKLQSFKVSS